MIQSYSSMATFKQCPAKYKYAYIDRIEGGESPPSPAMERGSAIHDSVEAFLLGKNEFLHPDIHKDYGQFMFSLREEGAELKPEFKWGITWEFEPCDYKDPRAMVHGYIDLLAVKDESIDIYEWKTGGKYPEHRDQGRLYSVAMLAHYPEAKQSDTTITYFDKKDYDKIVYPQGMMFEYKPMLRNKIGAIADATRFPPMPTFKCKWCKFSRHNGGPCQF